jgi:RimJ/RimL family protein N-acetyltransferase
MTRWEGTPVLAERLVLRTFRPDDLSRYAALNARPEVFRYLSGKPMSGEDSNDIAAWANDVYARDRWVARSGTPLRRVLSRDVRVAPPILHAG